MNVTRTTVRLPSGDDASAIADLLNEHAVAFHGEPDVDVAVVRDWLGREDLVVRVAERAGELVCYGDMDVSHDGSRANLDIRALPSAPDSASDMLAELERVAAERGVTRVRAFSASQETGYVELLEARGFRPIRHSFRMTIALDGALSRPAWPDGVTVRTMRAGEERSVHAANDEAFADHWDFEPRPYERWARDVFEGERFDPSLQFLAVEGDEIAGICLCSLHWSGDPRHGWVGILGVRPRWRRRGIGIALLQHAFGELRARGCTRVGLGVDGRNTTGAVALYERAGMHVERRQDTFERTL